MVSIRKLVEDLRESVSSGSVEGIIRELLSRFFADYDLPIPKLKFVNKLQARYLALCKWYPGSENTEIEIQKAALSSEDTLRRVLAHELIHHWQYLKTDQFHASALARLGFAPDAHGADFEHYAAKINSVMGADYVSKTSDKTYDTSEVPPFYILIQPHNGTRLGYSVALRPSEKQKLEIRDRIQTKQAKLFRITDGRLTTAVPIKHNGGYVAPKDPESDQAAALRELWLSGKEITL
jgi:hypothetical protein